MANEIDLSAFDEPVKNELDLSAFDEPVKKKDLTTPTGGKDATRGSLPVGIAAPTTSEEGTSEEVSPFGIAGAKPITQKEQEATKEQEVADNIDHSLKGYTPLHGAIPDIKDESKFMEKDRVLRDRQKKVDQAKEYLKNKGLQIHNSETEKEGYTNTLVNLGLNEKEINNVMGAVEKTGEAQAVNDYVKKRIENTLSEGFSPKSSDALINRISVDRQLKEQDIVAGLETLTPDQRKLYDINNELAELNKKKDKTAADLSKIAGLRESRYHIDSSFKPLYDNVTGKALESANIDPEINADQTEAKANQYRETYKDKLGSIYTDKAHTYQYYRDKYTPEMQALTVSDFTTGDIEDVKYGIAKPRGAEYERKKKEAIALRDKYLNAKQDFDAITQAYLVNTDPSGEDKGTFAHYMRTGAGAAMSALVPKEIFPVGAPAFINDPDGKKFAQTFNAILEDKHIPLTEAQKEEAKTNFGESVADGIGGLVGILPKLLVAKNLFGVASEFAGLAGVIQKLEKGTELSKIGAKLLNASIEEASMEAAGLAPGAGAGFALSHDLLKNAGLKLKGPLGAIVQPFVDKVIGGAIGGTAGMETASALEGTIDGLKYNKTISEELDKRFPSLSEVGKRLASEFIVNGVFGMTQVNKADRTINAEKLNKLADELYKSGNKAEAEQVRKKANQIAGINEESLKLTKGEIEGKGTEQFVAPKNVTQGEIEAVAQKVKNHDQFTDRENEIVAALPQQVNNALKSIGEAPLPEAALEITTPLEENVGQMVNYEGVEGVLKTDKEGNLFVHTDDGGEVLIEGGLSGKPASELGVRFATPKPEVKLEEQHTEEIPDNQITYDYDNNTVNIYGKDYTYEGVETDAKGNTTALRVTDANGKVKFIRNENAIVEFEIQKELAENRQLDNVTAEEITKIADENEITSETKPVEPSETTAEQVQQERPTEVTPTLKVEEIKVEPTEKKDKKASMLDELHAAMGTEPEAKVEEPKLEEPKKSRAKKPAAEVVTEKTVDQLDTKKRGDVQNKVISKAKGIIKAVAKVAKEVSKREAEDGDVVYVESTIAGREPNKMVFDKGEWKEDVNGDLYSTTEERAKSADIKFKEGKELTLHVHDDAATYKEAVVSAGGTAQEASGSKGFWMSPDGEIHLNMEKVTEETLEHEGFHPVLDYITENRPEMLNKLHDQLNNVPGGKEVIARAEEEYAKWSAETRKKEAITDYIARVASGDIKIDRTNFEKVRDFIVKALNELGFNVGLDINTIEDLQDLARNISIKFETGQEIKVSETRVGDIEGSKPQFQVEKLLTGEEEAPTFKKLEDVAKWLQAWSKKNKIITGSIDKVSDKKFVDNLVDHTKKELKAWETVNEGYEGFYDEDIPQNLNPELVKWAQDTHGKKLTNEEISLYHILSSFASPSATPVFDSNIGLQIFDKYLKTGELSAYGEKPATIWAKNKAGKKYSTGEPKLNEKGEPVMGQIAPYYAADSLEKFKKIVDHFNGDVKKAVNWVESQHSYKEHSEMMGTPLKGSKKLKPHENLSEENGGFGVFAISGPKLGSYVLNRVGNYSTVTKDLWYARTMARFFGEPLVDKKGKVLKEPWSTTKEGIKRRRLADEAWGKVAKELNTSPAVVQQRVWDVEKKVWEKLGAERSKASTASEGLKKGIKVVAKKGTLQLSMTPESRKAIEENTVEEITRLKGLNKKAEDGATMNLDGTKYEGGGLVVPVESMNTTQGKLTPKMIADFVEANKSKIPEGSTFKVGLYKFPGKSQVSIDLNIVADPAHKDVALKFGKLAGQESLFNLDDFQNLKTGASGANPRKFSDKQYREISSALAEGRKPKISGDEDLVKGTYVEPHMTESTDGENFVFYHVSGADPKSIAKGIDSTKEYTTATSKGEKGSQYGVASFYTKPTDSERMIGGTKYTVSVPKEKVYPMNEDPNNYRPAAEETYPESTPDRQNKVRKAMAESAKNDGYEMAIGEWGYKRTGKASEGPAMRADALVPLKPTEVGQKGYEGPEIPHPEKDMLIAQDKVKEFAAKVYDMKSKAKKHDDVYMMAELAKDSGITTAADFEALTKDLKGDLAKEAEALKPTVEIAVTEPAPRPKKDLQLSMAEPEKMSPEQESKLKAFVDRKIKAGESIEDVKDVLVDYGVAKDKIAELVGEKPAAETPQAGSVGVGGDVVVEIDDNQPYTFKQIKSPIKGNSIVVDGEVVGGIEYSSGMDGSAEINFIEINPKYKNKGYAKKIIKDILKDSQNKEIIGLATKESLQFWKKIGADFIGVADKDGTIDFKLTETNFNKAVEQSLKETPQAGVGVGGEVETTAKALEDVDVDEILQSNENRKYNPTTEAKVDAFSETDDIGYPDSHLGLQVRIDNIVVPKSKRSKGIGTKEFNSIVKWAKSIGAEQIIIESERDAIPFWEKMGFEINDQGSDVSTGIYKLNTKEKAIAEAYHKAKSDGTNPELVKAVEQSLKETPQAGSVGVGGDVKLYHGTYADIKEFKTQEDSNNGAMGEELGVHFGTKEAALDKLKENAGDEDYAKGQISKGGRVIEAEAEIKTPLQVKTDVGDWSDINKVKEALSDNFTAKELKEIKTIKQLRDFIISKGYDAVEYPNNYEGKKGEKSYIILNPSTAKIKSVEAVEQSLKETPQAKEIAPQKETIGKFSELTNFDQQLEDASTTAKKKQIEANRDKWLNENPSMKDIYSNAKEIIKQLEKEGLVTEKKGPCM